MIEFVATEKVRGISRQVPANRATGHRLVKDIKTTAREFGAGSQLRFDK